MLEKTAPALRTALVLALASACTSRSPVVISEFLASNTKGAKDGDGDTSDWIELHNSGSSSLDLEGWCLTDDPRNPARWCFPAVSIPAKGYLLVFASGKNGSSTETELHTTFRLKATQDYLGLRQPSGSMAQEFAPYPDQKSDISFGLTSSGKPGFLREPTPGGPNSEAL